MHMRWKVQITGMDIFEANFILTIAYLFRSSALVKLFYFFTKETLK